MGRTSIRRGHWASSGGRSLTAQSLEWYEGSARPFSGPRGRRPGALRHTTTGAAGREDGASREALPADRRSVVADAVRHVRPDAGFHGNDVDSNRQRREPPAARQAAGFDETTERPS